MEIKIILIHNCKECPYSEMTEPDPSAVNAKGYLRCKQKDKAIYDDKDFPYWCPITMFIFTPEKD